MASIHFAKKKKEVSYGRRPIQVMYRRQSLTKPVYLAKHPIRFILEST